MRSLSSSDFTLARRLEAADAAIGLASAEATAAAQPHLRACAEPFAGGYLVFGGVGSPMTHVLGAGMEGHVSPSEFARMEEFFRSRGSAALIDLCPLADPALVQYIQDRDYRVIEFNNVLARRLHSGEVFPLDVRVRRVKENEFDLWTRTLARGFLGHDDVLPEYLEMLSGISRVGDCFLGLQGNQPAAGGAVRLDRGIASFFGDATLNSARNHGLQRALIDVRLAHATAAGCDLAAVSVIPGSGSHRNYERAGFELIYMKVNLSREWT